MAEQKTLQFLNDKWWYRLIKVIYIGSFLFGVLAIGVIIFFEEGGFKTLDVDKTIVTCNLEESSAPFPLSEAGSYYFSADDFTGKTFNYEKYFRSYESEYGIRSILVRCKQGNPEAQNNIYVLDVLLTQRAYEIAKTNLSQEEKNELFTQERQKFSDGQFTTTQKLSFLDFSEKLFDITPTYDHTTTILHIIRSVLLLGLCFELIRRIFYYIFLGTFRPK